MTRPLVAVLNGPNLNLLGVREPALYGAATIDDLEALCVETADALDLAIDFRQSNHEGELITWVQECRTRARGIIINPGGYSHTSVEEFRHRSLTSRAAQGVICGLGIRGYGLALTALAEMLLDEDQ
jgi:3-dehydroquinate dehydratase-2